jgi:hypothetical protein
MSERSGGRDAPASAGSSDDHPLSKFAISGIRNDVRLYRKIFIDEGYMDDDQREKRR